MVGLSASEKTDNSEIVSSVAFSNGGRSCSRRTFGRCAGSCKSLGAGVIAVWDLNTRHRPTIFAAHTDGIRAIAFAPDDKLIATAGCDGRITLWNIAARREQTTFSSRPGAA